MSSIIYTESDFYDMINELDIRMKGHSFMKKYNNISNIQLIHILNAYYTKNIDNKHIKTYGKTQ